MSGGIVSSKRKTYINLKEFFYSMIAITPRGRFRSIRQFEFIAEKKVGCGSFGVVKLARHRMTTRMYAIKIITLSDIPTETELKLVQRQIAVHSTVDHPHLIKLWDTILDDEQVYMVMEFAEKGNLFYHQNTKTTFTQPQAFKFFMQTLQGISYLHENNIIHRDLKPQNLLLDAYHNIKICDLGWAAYDINMQRTTFCGTYEYMAPQMLFKTQYDYRVDIWALGVLLYQLLHGYAPFKGKTAPQVQESMLKGGYQINPKLSEPVRDLIASILQISVGKRVSLKKIMEHQWVKQMESHVDGYLTIQKVQMPSEVHEKLAKVPPIVSQLFRKETFDHRKNNSMNIEPPGQASVDLIYASLHPKKNKNCFHSQDKENKESVPRVSPKELAGCSSSGFLRKNKMLIAVKTQMSEMQSYKLPQKPKSKKSTKGGARDLPSFQKSISGVEASPFRESTNKKKQKINTRSQVQMLAEKYPVRFNTQAFEKDQIEPVKLKKSHMGTKLAYSRSALRLPKGGKGY